MPERVAVIQTTWPKIRVGLYRRKDGRFQFVEEGIQTDKQGNHFWFHYVESGLYDDFETAKNAMVEHYCFRTEDEYTVDPNSVTVLYEPDFTGPHSVPIRDGRWGKSRKSKSRAYVTQRSLKR